MNDKLSSEKPILTGVPQGSVLGPLLFLIYVNSLANLKLNSSLIMYADDTVIYSSLSKRPTQQEIENYQEDLDCIGAWCQVNKLSINVGKTKLMTFGKALRGMSHVQFKLNNSVLSFTENYKYLGLMLNNKLTLVQHANTVIGMVSTKLRTLSYLRRYVNSEIALIIYKTMILSLFEYANLTYTLMPVKLRKKNAAVAR